ncbi:MAG TPA: ABC transporter ATP-binding protein [Ramlibacter sp.]|nr:ABC transporter ATP-binding protein [Ramlibacter sp.]
MAHVQLSHLRKSHGANTVVDDVSLEIPSGKFFTLLGPSGCGKSSTLRIVAGLSQPDAGRVLIDGKDVTALESRHRRIGMVFQSLALFPHMTVLENVAFGLRMRGVPASEQQQRVRRAIDLVHLGAMAGRYPHQLSGGQQQRVALARALVVEPAILILDEPFGALDRKLREAMQTELYRITRELGTTTLFVTHDQEEALMLSDGVVVMNQGRIEQAGAPAEIFERPRTRFVAEFMGLSNFARARVVGTDGGATLQALGCSFEAPAGDQPLALGAEVDVALRPERIRLALQAPAAGARSPGQVTQAIYHGHVSEYVVRLESGELLNVRQENDTAGGGPIRVGTPVWTHWRPSAVHVLQG